MKPHAPVNRRVSFVPNALRIAERLRAHARLCRQIAEVSWNEEVAGRLRRLADDCSRTADDAEPKGEPIPGAKH
jgi:hypothetical protein